MYEFIVTEAYVLYPYYKVLPDCRSVCILMQIIK